MRFAIFFSVALIISTGLHYYVLYRLCAGRPELLRRRKRLIWIALALVAFQMLAMSVRAISLESAFGDSLQWIASILMGFGALLFSGLALRDLIWLGLFATEKVGGPALLPENPERRRLLLDSLNLGVAAAATAGTAIGAVQARHGFEIVEVDVPIEGLDPALDGYRIVQISDIHVGPTIKADFIQKIVERVNAQSPDLIAITGDLVDGSLKHLSRDVEPLRELKAKDGVYFVTGNHEYYSGAEPWIEFLRDLDIDVLLNEHRVVQRDAAKLVVGGVTDYSAGSRMATHESDPARAFANAPKASARILLAHQPRSVYAAAKHEVDLQLSGHTHGGQFMPWNLLVALAQPYLKGLERVRESVRPMWIYVHRGTGYWGPPNRLGIPPEIAVIRLRA